MFKELIKKRDEAKKEYDEISKTVRPYWDRFMEAEKDIKDKFIEEKLYIPIEKLKDYLGTRDAESFTIVYENGKTERLYHNYGIGFEWVWKNGKHTNNYDIIASGTDDDGYYFKYDIKEEGIVGFYDLSVDDKEIKETFMEEIIKNLD